MLWNEPTQAELAELILLLRDDEISPEELKRLEQMLLELPEARQQYLQMMELHADLHWRMGSDNNLANEKFPHEKPPESGATETKPAKLPVKSLPQVLMGFVQQPTTLSFAVAALVLGVVIASLAIISPPSYFAGDFAGDGDEDGMRASDSLDPNDICARLTGLEDAVWHASQSRESQLHAGDQLQLESGWAEVTFADGARVVVQGPAHFQIVSSSSGRLIRGQLAAEVGKHAVGFKVALPTAKLVDLGTRFGAVVDASGMQEIHVLEGSVEVTAKKNSQLVVLRAGNAITVDADGNLVNQMPSVAEKFVEEINGPPAPPTLQGNVVYIERDKESQEKNQEQELPRRNDAIVICEAAAVQTSASLLVNLTGPGEINFGTGHIELRPRGKFDVYLVHFFPPERRNVQGEIQFNGRVVGVISRTELLTAAESQLKLPYATSDGLDDDDFELLDDGRTVRFSLRALKADQFRVLVERD